MKKEYIKLIQKKVIDLLRSKSDKPLFLLAKDNCSELSRLTGSWILQDYSGVGVFIIKGEGINNNKDLNHDILVIDDQSNFYIIDPAIWQFFEDSKDILINITNSIEDVYHELELKYGGHWKISEKLEAISKEQKSEWKKIIQENIKGV